MDTAEKVEIRHESPSVEQYLALRVEAGLSPMSVEGYDRASAFLLCSIPL